MLYADAWFDVNEVFRVLFGKGYNPIIYLNKTRGRGYYRRKGRRLYKMREYRFGHRQRGKREGLFGSLTNMEIDLLLERIL